MKHLLYSLITFLLIGCSSDENINNECASANKDSWIAKVQCISRRDKEEREYKKLVAKEAEEAQKEKNARGCIAQDLNRMESLVKTLGGYVTETSTLGELQTKFSSTLGYETSIQPPENNIKERVLIARVDTKCPSKFYLLVNVRAQEDGQINFFNVWAENPPEGYSSGLHSELSTNYALIRAQKLRAKADAIIKNSAPSNTGDPCAPNLSKATRLARLSQYGTVKQNSQGYYSVTEPNGKSHVVSYDEYLGNLKQCW